MKQQAIFASFTLLLLITAESCTSFICVSKDYSAREVKESCVTEEPGTYLNPRCNIAARMAAEYHFNPDTAYIERERLIRMITKKVNNRDEVLIPVHEGEIRLWIYNDEKHPDRVNRPVVVYLHGGGFQHGTLETFDYYTRKLAVSIDVVLVAVEYRLAPEFIFPVAVNDAYTGLLWVAENISSFGGDPSLIYLMGGSAGGNLAAVLPFVSNDRKGPPVAGQILCYPALDFCDNEYPSREYFSSNDGKFILTRDFLLNCKNTYLGIEEDATHRYVSPLMADLNFDMPPALIITAQCDPLRDEGRLYAEKLSADGFKVDYHEYKGMIHAFMPLYPMIREGRKAIKLVSEFVNPK